MDNVDSDNIKNKINNYEKAKGNINQAIEKLVEVKSILNNKKYFESDRISGMVSDIDSCIADLKNKKSSISSSINAIRSLSETQIDEA